MRSEVSGEGLSRRSTGPRRCTGCTRRRRGSAAARRNGRSAGLSAIGSVGSSYMVPRRRRDLFHCPQDRNRRQVAEKTGAGTGIERSDVTIPRVFLGRRRCCSTSARSEWVRRRWSPPSCGERLDRDSNASDSPRLRAKFPSLSKPFGLTVRPKRQRLPIKVASQGNGPPSGLVPDPRLPGETTGRAMSKSRCARSMVLELFLLLLIDQAGRGQTTGSIVAARG